MKDSLSVYEEIEKRIDDNFVGMYQVKEFFKELAYKIKYKI